MTAFGLVPRRMRSVRACSGRAGSMFQERGSLSTNTGVAADLPLEGLDVGAGGGDPVGAEGLVDEVQLAAAHVGWREVEAGRGDLRGGDGGGPIDSTVRSWRRAPKGGACRSPVTRKRARPCDESLILFWETCMA